MFVDHIPIDTSQFEAGRSIYIEGGRTAVLLLHGWTGWPGRLASAAKALGAAGYTVHVPRLPGHGTRMADLLQTTAQDWLRRAIDSYLDLRQAHDEVLVVGTSMGAIMATIVAAKYKVPRIALLAPALLTRNRFIPFARFIRPFVRRIQGDWKPNEELNPLSREIGEEYSTHTYISMVAELYRMQRWGRRALVRLKADTLVIASEEDQSVPIGVVEYIRKNRAGGEFAHLVLKKSSHQLCDDIEKDRVAQAVVNWFEERL
jgi:carboxylesterase